MDDIPVGDVPEVDHYPEAATRLGDGCHWGGGQTADVILQGVYPADAIPVSRQMGGSRIQDAAQLLADWAFRQKADWVWLPALPLVVLPALPLVVSQVWQLAV